MCEFYAFVAILHKIQKNPYLCQTASLGGGMVDTRDLDKIFDNLYNTAVIHNFADYNSDISKAKYSTEDVRNAVRDSKSIAGVLRSLGLRP